MLGRLPRRVEGAEFDVAHAERVALAEEDDVIVIRLRPLGLPVRISLIRNVNRRAVARGELTHAGEKVGVDVRLGYRRDAEPLSLGQLHVLIDVAQGVDDEGLPGALATD